MLNSLAILFAIEAVLILQPTGMYNMVQKQRVSLNMSSKIRALATSYI